MFYKRNNILPTLFTILIGIITGVIGNRVDALFFSSNPLPKALFLANLIPWVIAAILLVCLFSAIYFRWFDEKMWEKLLIFDEGLLRLLPNLIGKNDLDERFTKLIDRLLIHTAMKFPPGIRRGILLQPDKNRNREYLVITNSVGVEEDYEKLDEFYIGTDRDKLNGRGIAGKAFQEKKPFTVYIQITAENKLSPSDADYLVLKHTGSEDGDFPPYKSLICIPILDGPPIKNVHKECLGVLCFDSQNITMFDSYQSQKKLELLTKHMCAAMRMYDALKKI